MSLKYCLFEQITNGDKNILESLETHEIFNSNPAGKKSNGGKLAS